MAPTKNLPFVLFQIREGLYAVSSEYVREMVMLPAVVHVPSLPPQFRGVINLRGKVIRLIDLRVVFGLPSAKAELEELIQLLHDRENDHKNWLTELEGCVRERREFKLARDPHACKFGLWYDHYQTDNSMLKMVLKKMDEPHRAIHACANEILKVAGGGDIEGAMKLLTERRNKELALLVQLFEEARRLLREEHHELAVVLARGEERLAVTVDLVEAVERIPEENIEPMPASVAGMSRGMNCRVGKRLKTGQTALIINEQALF